jgi:hypothetical protein
MVSLNNATTAGTRESGQLAPNRHRPESGAIGARPSNGQHEKEMTAERPTRAPANAHTPAPPMRRAATCRVGESTANYARREPGPPGARPFKGQHSNETTTERPTHPPRHPHPLAPRALATHEPSQPVANQVAIGARPLNGRHENETTTERPTRAPANTHTPAPPMRRISETRVRQIDDELRSTRTRATQHSAFQRSTPQRGDR